LSTLREKSAEICGKIRENLREKNLRHLREKNLRKSAGKSPKICGKKSAPSAGKSPKICGKKPCGETSLPLPSIQVPTFYLTDFQGEKLPVQRRIQTRIAQGQVAQAEAGLVFLQGIGCDAVTEVPGRPAVAPEREEGDVRGGVLRAKYAG
jgi:hypothetical protein